MKIIMPKFETFGDFVRVKFKTQANAAKLLKTRQNVISNWATGRNKPEPEMQDQLREKWGFDGPWPADKAQDAQAGGPAPYVTREEFAEEKGSLRTEVRLLRESLEKMGESVRLLLQEREESRQAGRR